MNHTKGPWKLIANGSGVLGLMHPKKKGVAVAWFSSFYQPSSGYVGDDKPRVSVRERQANAHLMAAAPAMYAALKTVSQSDQFNVLSETEQQMVKKAIEEAKGKSVT